eukprot:TRINITY_DN11000_c0_g3_i1.p1 TRINITY_DN11000_c0_g3~~TRINITY_DN11000_c0_g3_i1.p1  ORF type:complete len:354 (+),score=92.90 TRINITY_DN11000_c0_g3_i1:559-1620(+)
MDRLTEKDKILAIAATSKLDEVDPQLRRGGRFDLEIRMEAPDFAERVALLENMFDGVEVEADLERAARETSGFAPADLVALAREACINSWRRVKEIKVRKEDLEKALFDIRPSNIKDLIAKIPEVHWEDIGGNSDVKELVKQCIEWPLKHPKAFANVGISPPQGILLYGPPGCSKTMVAKAIATESKLNFIGIKGPELFSKYVGDTEKAIRDIFRKARISAPCIIFFDEIDAMATERGNSNEGTNVSDRALCQLLNELDGYEALNQVVVVAATNRPMSIDKALLRPGRMDRLIYVREPDAAGREEVLRIHTKRMPLSKDVDIKKLAEKMEGYSGAELALACREAGMNALSTIS